MHILTTDKYEIAAQNIADVNINCFFAKSVIQHHVKGQIFVDDTERPKAFYVLHPYQMSLLYGAISVDFINNQLKSYLLNTNGSRKKDEYLQVFPSNIEAEIDKLVAQSMCVFDSRVEIDESQYSVVKHQRVNFKFNQTTFRNLVNRIDLSLYSYSPVDLSHFNEFHGSVVPNQFWHNASDFSSQGFGYVLYYYDQPASVAFSSFMHEGFLELGMETKKSYRRKGLATYVCAKLIDYCLDNNLEPVWSCRLSNEASYNLALKLGFEPTAYLPYYDLL